MKVSTQVISALEAAEINGSVLKLIGQLDRKIYLDVSKVLESVGGKWNRKAGGHLFSEDPTEIIDRIILTGEATNAKQEMGAFFTPRSIADQVAEIGDIRAEHRILEPSAGQGSILQAIGPKPDKVAVEINPRFVDQLARGGAPSGTHIICADFLTCGADLGTFDRVLMNPPFSRQADIHHVRHAATFLKPGGRLVSIMSPSFLFRSNRLSAEFRCFLEDHGVSMEDVIRLPEGSFRESGTGVNAVIVAFNT